MLKRRNTGVAKLCERPEADGQLAKRIGVELTGAVNGAVPERIVIGHDSILGLCNGTTRVYALEIMPVETSFYPQEQDGTEEEDYVVKPQMELARALNRYFGGTYRILDRAERRVWVDAQQRLCVSYRSVAVELISR